MVDRRALRESSTFPADVLAEIHRAADQGIYDIRGFGAKRKVPSFDDLLFDKPTHFHHLISEVLHFLVEFLRDMLISVD